MQTLLVVGMLLSPSLWAGTWQDYSAEKFSQAQKAGKTIVLDFKAPWCSTCKKQGPLFASLLEEKASNNIVAFKVENKSHWEEV